MKRMLALLMVLTMLASGACADGVQSGILINGTEITFCDDQGNPLEPVLMAGRLYAPAEQLGDKLCIDVETDPQQKTVKINGERVSFSAGGQNVPAEVIDGLVYVPVLLFANAAGVEITLDGTDYCLASEALRDYQTGDAALKAGDYDQACTSFARAGEFSDAPDRIREARYLQAEALLAQGKYSAAVEAFGKAGSYKDAASRVGEPWYLQAEQQLARGKYVAAAESFQKAGSYKDAASRVGEAWYLQGNQLAFQGKMEEAAAAYKKAGDYKDAASLAVGVFADDGLRKLDAGDYKGAYAAFAKVTDLKDGQQYLCQVLYKLAGKQFDAGKTEQAMSLYQLLGDYSDAKTKAAEYYYKQGSTAEAAGKKTTAIEAYKQAGDYQDAQEKWKKLTYSLAKSHQSNEKYDDAYALYDTIRGYSDVDSRLSSSTGLKNAAKRAESKKLAAQISKGDTFKFGSYALVESGSTGKQTIEWTVMKVDGSKLFLISRYAVEKKPYHTSNTKTITWSNCSLRTWLNNSFLQNAFTQSERNAIVSTSNTSKTATGGTTSTKDKIFLPTYWELVNHLGMEDRKTTTKKNVAVSYWSRDRYTGMNNSSSAFAQTISASAESTYQKVTNSFYVRPAMWINLETNYDWSACIAKTSTTDKYAAIRKLMAAGAYEEALAKLGKQDAATEVTELTHECRYQLGCEALRNGDLTKAVSNLNQLRSAKYKDSVELLAIIDLLK